MQPNDPHIRPLHEIKFQIEHVIVGASKLEEFKIMCMNKHIPVKDMLSSEYSEPFQCVVMIQACDYFNLIEDLDMYSAIGLSARKGDGTRSAYAIYPRLDAECQYIGNVRPSTLQDALDTHNDDGLIIVDPYHLLAFKIGA